MIEPIDEHWIRVAQDRQLQLTKPPESLGRLEEIANRLAAIQRTETPEIRKPAILVFAADHGVCEEQVSPYPQAVTAQMVSNFLRGGAAINALARAAGAELSVIDVGVAHEIPFSDGLISRKIACGTRNFCREPAMSLEQARASLAAGMDMADRAVEAGSNLIGIGEIGIGNTTAAAALTAALTGADPALVAGRGTGAGDECMRRKIDAIARALVLHHPGPQDGMGMLAALGGFEIGAMAGACLQAASHRCAVIADGFIATTAAALAARMQPLLRGYLFAAHRSTEPGHGPLLELIGQAPILDLQMRLGEGTGAALAIPILRAAACALSHMATFQAASVSNSVSGDSR